jgi:hypothetical protein
MKILRSAVLALVAAAALLFGATVAAQETPTSPAGTPAGGTPGETPGAVETPAGGSPTAPAEEVPDTGTGPTSDDGSAVIWLLAATAGAGALAAGAGAALRSRLR